MRCLTTATSTNKTVPNVTLPPPQRGSAGDRRKHHGTGLPTPRASEVKVKSEGTEEEVDFCGLHSLISSTGLRQDQSQKPAYLNLVRGKN